MNDTAEVCDYIKPRPQKHLSEEEFFDIILLQ